MIMNNSNRTVAIHQPNFFPWLGYFDKINRGDIFVFMDDVLYPKSGSGMGTWSNRVKILIQGKEHWIGCPVIREHGAQIIRKVIINNQQKWQEKILKTIKYNYAGAPFFKETMVWLEPLIMDKEELLAEYNIKNILAISKLLGIESSFIRQSELETSFSSTDLLIEIVKKVDGQAYLCGGGASGYQEDDKFDLAGLKLIYQDFDHPIYTQSGVNFVPGLSIIDAIMNLGIEGTRDILNNHIELGLQENHSC
ncbi:MAG: WbqC family protein [Syntrophomonadaceae bacterium]|nr:WbqC family protein [Syntrophomonadaceae bacterium]